MVVIGSGATAVMLVPELAREAAGVTMLQRMLPDDPMVLAGVALVARRRLQRPDERDYAKRWEKFPFSQSGRRGLLGERRRKRV